VCTFSYVSYLAQRYWAAAARGLWMAALGGLYSSTATTVVLAHQARANPALKPQADAGITLATAIMYLRIEAVIAIFNQSLARLLLPPLLGLAAAGFALCALQYWWLDRTAQDVERPAMPPANSANPLQFGPAAIFAVLFVAISLASNFATSQFGTAGIYALAAIIGFSDIDPFVLNLAQGGAGGGVAEAALAAAILIAASSNNVLKAGYAIAFAGGRTTAASAIALVVLAIAGVVVALFMAGAL